MYNTKDIAKRIKDRAKQHGIPVKQLLADCDLNINTLSDFAKGSKLSCVSLARIADVLNCSVDYLLGRTEEPEVRR